MAEPKITVIVPVYNVEKIFAGMSDSLAAQTYPNLQVLVVNDGSTDTSPQIIADYVRRFLACLQLNA
ncbi:MAG: glycosyltransferase family 2 protein [Holdemania massiliensis]